MTVEMISIDVSELQEGDVIHGCEDLGPVTHIREVSVDYGNGGPGVGYRVYSDEGSDLFGAPQRVYVIRT